jgi:hypothetical protein
MAARSSEGISDLVICIAIDQMPPIGSYQPDLLPRVEQRFIQAPAASIQAVGLERPSLFRRQEKCLNFSA